MSGYYDNKAFVKAYRDILNNPLQKPEPKKRPLHIWFVVILFVLAALLIVFFVVIKPWLDATPAPS